MKSISLKRKVMIKMRINQSKGEKIFNIINSLIMLIIIFLTLYPFWYCVVGSLNEGLDYMRGGVYWWPRKFTWANYAVVLSDNTILQAYKITILRTIIGTVSTVLVTALFAYAFSKNYLIGRKVYATLGIITMYFGGGMIPTYLTIKMLGLLDNFLVYILPGLFGFYNALIFHTFFREIPQSLFDSAKIDGAGEYRTFFSIVLPLSTPVLATIALFVAVGHWNSYFDAMLYTNTESLQPMQLYLMKIIRTKAAAAQKINDASASLHTEQGTVNSTTVQYAAMMITVIPILLVYPFLQRYFVKGIMIGSIKG